MSLHFQLPPASVVKSQPWRSRPSGPTHGAKHLVAVFDYSAQIRTKPYRLEAVMVEHRLFVDSSDVSGTPQTATGWEISEDGTHYRALSAAEQRVGLVIMPGASFTIRAQKRGAWTVCQGLTLTDDGASLVYANDADFGTLSTNSTPVQERGTGLIRHEYSACMSLFRDAQPDRTQYENNPPPAYMYTVLSFSGAEILSSGGTGLDRLAAGRSTNVVSYGDGVGDLLYVKAPTDSGKPQECAVFVPRGIDLSEPVPIHLFYSPSTGGKKLPYPYSDGDNSFNAMIHNYLISGGKRFLSQHGASGKACVFVFPLPSPQAYFGNLQTAASVRSFCLELVYYLRKTGNIPTNAPSLGTCALSGFSEGGRPLAAVIGSSPTGSAFPELEELYLLDVMPPSGSSADTGSYHRLMGMLNGWWASGAGKRKVRFYSQFYAFGLSLAIRGKLVNSNAGALEYQAGGATCLFTPRGFWSKLSQEEDGSNTNPGYELDNVHQLMPCLFLQHALRNSNFPDSG